MQVNRTKLLVTLVAVLSVCGLATWVWIQSPIVYLLASAGVGIIGFTVFMFCVKARFGVGFLPLIILILSRELVRAFLLPSHPPILENVQGSAITVLVFVALLLVFKSRIAKWTGTIKPTEV